MNNVSLYMEIPSEYKKYLKKKAIDEDTTMTNYVIRLIKKDMEENEVK